MDIQDFGLGDLGESGGCSFEGREGGSGLEPGDRCWRWWCSERDSAWT